PARLRWYSMPPAARRPIRRGHSRFAAATSRHRVNAGSATRTSQGPARSGRRDTGSRWRRPSEWLLLSAESFAPGFPNLRSNESAGVGSPTLLAARVASRRISLGVLNQPQRALGIFNERRIRGRGIPGNLLLRGTESR